MNGGKVDVNIEGELTTSSQSIFHSHQGVDSETQSRGTRYGYTVTPSGIQRTHCAVDMASAKSHMGAKMLIQTLKSQEIETEDPPHARMEKGASVVNSLIGWDDFLHPQLPSAEREIKMTEPYSYDDLVPKVLELSTELKIFNSGYITGQFLKLTEKIGELAGAVRANDIPRIKRSSGNIQFLMINITKMKNGDAKGYIDKALKNIDSSSFDNPKNFNSALLVSLLSSTTSSLGGGIDSEGKYFPMKLPPIYLTYVWNNVIGLLTEMGNHFGFTPVDALGEIYDDLNSAHTVFKRDYQ